MPIRGRDVLEIHALAEEHVEHFGAGEVEDASLHGETHVSHREEQCSESETLPLNARDEEVPFGEGRELRNEPERIREDRASLRETDTERVELEEDRRAVALHRADERRESRCVLAAEAPTRNAKI